MNAIVYTRYGSPDVLEFAEVEPPVPKDDEVLVAVRAASVNPADWHFMRGTPFVARLMFGLRAPKITRLGIDLAGTVRAVGKDVTQFKAGDEVFGAGRGAFAEFACASPGKLARKPAALTFVQAAALPVAGMSALQSLRDIGRCRAGQKVLIAGASGGVGSFAVQIARAMGADVTAVCGPKNIAFVRSLGAQHVIDYTTEDFTRSSDRYDIILYVAGHHTPSQCRRALAPDGTYILLGHSDDGRWLGPVTAMLSAMMLSRFGSRKLRPFLAKVNAADLAALRELVESGKVTPVIDRTYPFREIPDAIRYQEAAHARGKVVITMP